MNDFFILFFSLLLAIKGCEENKLPQNTETIVWRLLYDINTKPKLDFSFEEPGGSTTEITLLNNGNIVFGVSATFPWDEPSLKQGYVFCYSKTGEQIWKYSYEDNAEGRINYIFQDKSGNLLCSGHVNRGNSNFYAMDLVITKLSINGEFVLFRKLRSHINMRN